MSGSRPKDNLKSSSGILKTFQVIWKRLRDELPFTKTSFSVLAIVLCMMVFVSVYWRHLMIDYFTRAGPDWLLIGIFLFMLCLLTFGASFKKDITLIVVGLFGGLMIESWGTQTLLWRYYTEFPPWNDPSRPPLWIIPAWPISTLTINRLYLILNSFWGASWKYFFRVSYFASMALFSILLVRFTIHTWDLIFTKIILVSSALMILTPVNCRRDFLIMISGAILGYFLEYWGTSRMCWIYYTKEVPPVFAVFAHGFSSVLFSRIALYSNYWINRWIGSKLITHRDP